MLKSEQKKSELKMLKYFKYLSRRLPTLGMGQGLAPFKQYREYS